MSIRLNVVLSQSADGPPQRRELESEIVARLIGAAGIDLSLIGSLDSLAENSTDRLMLERLGGDLALLSWATPAAAAERLAAARIPGRRAPHPLDPEAASANDSLTPTATGNELGERRVYHHSLGDHSPADLQGALERLLAARRVVTFRLAPTPRAPSPAASPAALPTHSPTQSSARPPSNSVGSSAGSSAGDSPAAPDPWDALVDELNDSNI